MFTGKYKIYRDDKNKIVAVSSYAGKSVRGVAKCDPRDDFDYDSGVKLAEARCAMKIAAKRRARAYREFEKATQAVNDAVKRLEKMRSYVNDAEREEDQAMFDLLSIENRL